MASRKYLLPRERSYFRDTKGEECDNERCSYRESLTSSESQIDGLRMIGGRWRKESD